MDSENAFAHEYLTARELAALLRVRERKVYELASAGEVPCSRATGKLLFRRAAIESWLARSSSGPAFDANVPREPVFAGSHDPLLEWALRESEAGLATYFDGSLEGIERFAARQAIATGLHVPGEAPGSNLTVMSGAMSGPDVAEAALAGGDPHWNIPLARARFGGEPVVLLAFARRERGLIVARDEEATIGGIVDLRDRRFAPRQAGAGSQVLFERLAAAAGLRSDGFERVAPVRTENESALAVAEGRADAAFGLPSLAGQFGLGFVPLVRERFDLLIDRRAWFEPALQRFAAFCRSAAFRERASGMPGYDTSVFGEVRFNG